MFQHTAARRRLAKPTARSPETIVVSTHSRPKAAGPIVICLILLHMCFNTQPPEGGWIIRACSIYLSA